jgi:hypothetical protein
MKITLERPSLMALKDYNISHFIGGILLIVVGVFIAFFLASGGLVVLAIGGVSALIGLWLLVSTKLVSISLDKGMNRAKFSLRSILKNESREVALEDIKSLTLEKEIRRSSKGKKRRQFSLIFVLGNGEELPFEFGSLAGTMDVLTSPEEKIRKQAQRVSEFLGVPLKQVGPPSTAETISAVKDAITAGMEKTKKSP